MNLPINEIITYLMWIIKTFEKALLSFVSNITGKRYDDWSDVLVDFGS